MRYHVVDNALVRKVSFNEQVIYYSDSKFC